MTAVEVTEDEKQHRRTAARINAVQALYQLRMRADANPQKVVEEFVAHRLSASDDPESVGEADGQHFTDIVAGVNEKAEEIDGLIETSLKSGWRIERLEHLLLSILRAGVYELLSCPHVPKGVIINEYVDVAKSFYDGTEAGFVNGVLDNLAEKCRA